MKTEKERIEFSSRIREIIESKYTKEERELMKVLAKRDAKKLDSKLFTYGLERKPMGGK